MTENEFNYWAFLSYSPQDNREQRPGATKAGHLRWADRLREALKSFPIPAELTNQINSRGEIIPGRIDTVYQPAPPPAEGTPLSEEARGALEQSRCLIVICSPRSARSPQVNETVRHFKQLGRGNRILPIVIAGEPNASDGAKPDAAPDAECFVPALLHPVLPDGSLDTTRRDSRYFFADARYGAERNEVSTNTELLAETELAIATIHLISGVLGVGFYGLWQREQKRRFVGFAEAQQHVREVQSQFEFARDQAQSAQAQLQALQAQTRETLSQLEAARHEVREAQNKLLANQNLPLDVHTQIREAQDKALDAQQQAQAMHNQLEALQAQARATQEQLETARQQVQTAEQKSLEAQQQSRIAQAQVEQARQQARDTQQQLESARQQVRAAPEQTLAVQPPTTEGQSQVQELQNQLLAAQEQTLAAQTQIEAAVSRAQAAEANRSAAQTHAAEARQQVQEFQDQIRAAQGKISESQQQAKTAQDQLQEIQSQTRDVQAQIQAAQKQIAEAKNQTRLAQAELSITQEKVRASQRLSKVFAVLAVLAALAAGVVLSHRKTSNPEVAKTSSTEVFQFGATTNQLDSEQIRLALQQTRDSDSLAAYIPKEKLGETFDLAATILTDPQRSRLQNQLLDTWVKTDVVAAFDWGRQLTNADTRQFALAKIIPAMAADSATNALVAFEWLQNPTNSAALPPGKLREVALTGLFRNWAAQDLEQAAAASEQLPADTTRPTVAAVVLSQRIQSDPAAAVSVVTNLPAGDDRKLRIAELGRSWAATDATNALAWAESLPVESDRALAVRFVVERWLETDWATATNWVAGLPEDAKIAKLLQLAESWAQKDARSLADHAFALPGGEVQTQLLTEACRALATNDFGATATLLQQLTNNAALRRQILEQTAGRTIASQLEPAAEFISGMPADEDQAAVIKGLIPNWESIAPEAALNWLRAFPETNAQPAQVEFVLNSWAQREPAAVAQWLAKQPTNSVNEAMFTAFLAGAVVRYPEFAAQWTQAVADAASRQKFQVQIAQQWLKHAASAAQKWIETLELPADIKKTLQ